MYSAKHYSTGPLMFHLGNWTALYCTALYSTVPCGGLRCKYTSVYTFFQLLNVLQGPTQLFQRAILMSGKERTHTVQSWEHTYQGGTKENQ